MVVILISISRAFNSGIMINREKHIVKGFARSPWRSDELVAEERLKFTICARGDGGEFA